MTQEVLKMALDALETELSIDWTNNDEFNASAEKMYEAIAAIKEALAKEKTLQALHDENQRLGLYKEAYAQPKQKPMAWYCCFQGQEEGEFFLFGSPNSERYPSQYKTPLYEHLPQRTWVGLTLDEIALLHANYPNPQGFALALQAKLKERNDHSI
jgi:hypothetical protein